MHFGFAARQSAVPKFSGFEVQFANVGYLAFEFGSLQTAWFKSLPPTQVVAAVPECLQGLFAAIIWLGTMSTVSKCAASAASISRMAAAAAGLLEETAIGLDSEMSVSKLKSTGGECGPWLTFVFSWFPPAPVFRT